MTYTTFTRIRIISLHIQYLSTAVTHMHFAMFANWLFSQQQRQLLFLCGLLIQLLIRDTLVEAMQNQNRVQHVYAYSYSAFQLESTLWFARCSPVHVQRSRSFVTKSPVAPLSSCRHSPHTFQPRYLEIVEYRLYIQALQSLPVCPCALRVQYLTPDLLSLRSLCSLALNHSLCLPVSEIQMHI